MKQPRILLSISLCVLVGGALCVGAAVLEESKAKGLLPPEAAALPSDARYLMGIDLRRFTASPLYAKRTAGKEPQLALVLADLRKVTGIDAERDVDQVIFAGGAPDGSNEVALVRGKWDAAKVSRTLGTAGGAGAPPQRKKGMSLYDLPVEGGRLPRAVLLLNDQALLFGPRAALASTLERPPGGPAAPVLAGLVKRVRPGAVLWVCGDGSVLSQADKVMPGAGGSFPLPDLKTLVLSAEVDPLLDATLAGEATDATAAKGMADTVRGLLALAAMQGARRPEMQELASAITVAQEGPSLTVSVKLPYELMDRLSRPRPRPAAPTARPAAP